MRPSHVVVWQGDGEPLPGIGYGNRIARRLRRAGCPVAVVDYRDQGLTDTQRAAPVHVLSGGETSAFAADDATTRALDELTALAQRAWADEVTIVGVCLGAQLLARVVAPELARSTPAAGMEAGWSPVTGPDGIVHVAEFHYEQIDPALASIDGVTITHHNARCAIQAFRWGPNVVGTQFHPEWSPADLRAVLAHGSAVLAEHHPAPHVALASLDDGAADTVPRPDLFDQLVLGPIVARLATSGRPVRTAPEDPYETRRRAGRQPA